MDILNISNFKCIGSFDLKLNRLTVLTGANGSGKSSIIQSVLLFRSIMDAAKLTNGTHIVPLNGYHSLSLGSFDDICRFGADYISFRLNDNVNVEINHYDHDFDGTTNAAEQNDNAEVSLNIADDTTLPSWIRANECYYLNAERIGPRWESDINQSVNSNSGDHGEYAGNLLLSASYTYPSIPERKRFSENTPDNFNIQTDSWMSYICSDVSFKSEPLTKEKCQVKIRQNSSTLGTPNTGFGYTYALPIVLNGLIAPEGSLMIVENPEAHLHPKAQSNIGFFLGKMAASGVKIIVETHSEHVVNGMRRAALSDFGLSPEDLTIYFSQEQKNTAQNPTEILVDSKGNLSDFPLDFFDQVRQDMLEIMRLANKQQ